MSTIEALLRALSNIQYSLMSNQTRPLLFIQSFDGTIPHFAANTYPLSEGRITFAGSSSCHSLIGRIHSVVPVSSR
jgi:hypothetical protein